MATPKPCYKTRFRDELDAKIALAAVRNMRKPANRAELRTYYCRKCRAWHLTSQPLGGSN